MSKRTRRKNRNPISFPLMGDVEYVKNDGFLFQWCCNCKARHIWHFHVMRGKTHDDDFVVISGARDFMVEKLRRFYHRMEGDKCK